MLRVIEELHGDARRRGLFFQTCDSVSDKDRRIELHGAEMLSFGSCSYLGLERHPALVRGAQEMTARYGTQFASSRGYLSAPPYPELEDTLSRIFEAHALVVQTTTLAHQAAFDVFLTERDAIVLDHQVHYSVQRAATLARAGGTRVELVRHEELEKAVDVVRGLARDYRHVWFATDGITSMYGDLAPVSLIREILGVADNVRVYVDDAHGMSWAGRHGRGSILSRMELSPRLVVATSLAKAFSAGGAVLVFADPAERERVRMCGGPMVFSGPLQPPLLGAALASAKLHLTPELDTLQARLGEIVRYANTRARELGLPLLVENEVPILFFRCGMPRVATEVAQRLTRDGLYVNVSMFPSVPMRRAGLRVGLTAEHTRADVDRLLGRVAVHLPAVLAEEHVSREELDRLFERTAVGALLDRAAQRATFTEVLGRYGGAVRPTTSRDAFEEADTDEAALECDPETLVVERYATIRDVDRALWDAHLGAGACASWDALVTAEAIFRGRGKPEHDWTWEYVVVRDAQRRVVGMTFFTTSQQKDDMLMRSAISRAVEARRVADPYFLTSRVTMAGHGMSEGSHLYLDRRGPWRAALRRIIEVGIAVQEESESDSLVLRDLPADDPALDAFMRAEGLVKVENLPSHYVDVTWRDTEELIEGLGSKRRRRLAREIVEEAARFVVTIHGPDADPGLADVLYGLYANVAARGLRINGFPLPGDVFAHLLRSPAWEIGTLALRADGDSGAPSPPIAAWAVHRSGDCDTWLIAGLDYRYVESHRTYKQLIHQVIRRARERGARRVHLGMTADLEKSRWGSRTRRTCLFVQSHADYNESLLREVVAEHGVSL